jgi:chromosome segregation ATPase
MTRNIKRSFYVEMIKKGLRGEVKIDHDNKEMKVLVGHAKRDDSSEAPKLLPLSNLSGGERSKTLICLIIAQHQFPPFR